MTDSPAYLAREALALAEDLGGQSLTQDLATAAAELLKRLAAAHLDLEDRRRVARENADGNADGWRAEAFRLRKILGPRAECSTKPASVRGEMLDAGETAKVPPPATPRDLAREILRRHGPWVGVYYLTRELMAHRLQQLCPELSLDRCASLLLEVDVENRTAKPAAG